MKRLFIGLITVLMLGIAACAARSASPGEEQTQQGESDTDEPATGQPITDGAYLGSKIWNDGLAEVAFYQVERTRNQYGQAADQSFMVGTYLVKHDFDVEAMAKGGGTPAFKYALFYEFESGSYQYKRNYVVNAARADLHPLKASFSSFDWCSNIYRELAFQADGTVDQLMRSDDYGNSARSFEHQPNAYPVEELPLLIRGLDFSTTDTQSFSVVQSDGTFIGARARLAGADSVETPAGTLEAERIVVTYDAPVQSLIGEETDTEEIYWRGTDLARLLLKVEAASGRYTMMLVEELRTAYWQENLWPRLARVEQRP